MLRKDRTGANPVTVGVVALLVILLACYMAFRKDNPLTTSFKLQAVFQTSNGVRANMPVRIAGVDVGKVTGVSAQNGTQASVVEMEIDEDGLPIHKDAELKIRPRIFLEGNYFVELSPGTPGQPSLGTGDTVPLTQTATPVQLDQVLTSLQQSTREDLQGLLQGFGDGLTNEPVAEDDESQDPSVRGKTAAQALNDSLRDAPGAARGTAVVNSAIVGDGNDVSATIKALDRLSRSLSGDTAALQDVVVNFNRTVSAFADESGALGETIAELPGTLKTANSTLTALNAAFPPTRAFAREILPGVEETQATIDAARPWLSQATALLSPDELQGLVGILAPTTEDLAKTGNGTLGLLEQQDLLAQCASKVLLPTGVIAIEDGPRSTGVSNYKEFFYALAGFNGESQNFDGNGQWIRATIGGSYRVETGEPGYEGVGKLYGSAALPPKGTRPAMVSALPPLDFDATCKDQQRPNLNSARTGPADGATQRRGRVLLPSSTGGSASASAVAAPRETVKPKAAKSASPKKSDGEQVARRAEKTDGDVTGGLLGVLNPLRSGGDE
ncbi:MAG: MCE family protein [Solirubrobacteraceae bacterium]|nr:MCE family protein [Solirubrobacteraceae bacterium]